MTLRSGLNPKSGQSYEKIVKKLQKNLEVKKKCVPLQSQTKTKRLRQQIPE